MATTNQLTRCVRPHLSRASGRGSCVRRTWLLEVADRFRSEGYRVPAEYELKYLRHNSSWWAFKLDDGLNKRYRCFPRGFRYIKGPNSVEFLDISDTLSIVLKTHDHSNAITCLID